jgi:hypothetical protein
VSHDEPHKLRSEVAKDFIRALRVRQVNLQIG